MKKIYFTVGDDGYIEGGISEGRMIGDSICSIEIRGDHDIFTSDSSCWKYENGKLVFDEERQQQLIEEYEREKNKPSETDVLAMAVMDLAELVLNGGGK